MKNQRRTNLARMLRNNQTPAERKLWAILCNRQIDGIKFRRQQPIGNYVVDFVSFEKRLIIEIDGGHHSEAKVEEKDSERTKRLKEQGFKFLRFWNNDVLQNTDGVFTRIKGTLQ